MSAPSCWLFFGYLYICFLGGTLQYIFDIISSMICTSWYQYNHSWAHSKNAKELIFVSSCLSVSLSTWNTAASTGQILVKIYIENFLIKINEPEVCLKLNKHEAYTTGPYNGDRLFSHRCTVWKQTFNYPTITTDIESFLWEVWAKSKEKVNELSITVKHEWLNLLSRVEQTWRHWENL